MSEPLATAVHDDLRREAAARFARVQSGTMSAGDMEALGAWLEADEAHGRAFDEVGAIWHAIEPARRAASLMGARERAHRAVRRRAHLRLLAPIAAAFVAAVVGAGVYWLRPATPEVYETRVGQTSAVRLADGSRVTLDTNSAVRVWPNGRRERRLELTRGRAHFEVAKDAGRPFVVRTSQGSVQALGTVFDVELRRKGLKVVLVEGRVRVQPSAGEGRALFLKAGSQVVADGPVWRMSQVDTQRETSWLRGELMFSEAPLSVVVAELNRYSNDEIRIADPAVGARRLSAVLRAGDTAIFAEAVERLKLARVRRAEPDVLILEAP